MGWGWFFSSMVYGDPWKERRRMFQKYFHLKHTELYEPIELEFTQKMLLSLLKSPDEFVSTLRQ